MHLLGSFMISFIFCGLYGAFRNTLYGGRYNNICYRVRATFHQCQTNAVGYEDKCSSFIVNNVLRSICFSEWCEIREMTELLECYRNVTDNCPDWRDQISKPWSIDNYYKFIIGTCVNRNVLDDGLKCLGSNLQYVNDYFEMNCINIVEWTNTTTHRMTIQQYCIRMINGIQCAVNKTQEFRCSDDFYDFLLHSTYVRLPVECFEPNSTEMKWHYMYTEIPTELPERQNREDTEDPKTVSSAACNYVSHVPILTLNLIVHFLQAVNSYHWKITF